MSPIWSKLREVESELALKLRRLPLIHRPIRLVRRFFHQLRLLLIEAIRKLPPPLSMGLPRDVYSDYEPLAAGAPGVEGRIILNDQGSPPLKPDSMTVLAGKHQHRYQPWPIFWTHLRDVELIGTSLAHVNRDGLLSKEAVYTYPFPNLHPSRDPAYYYFKGPRSRAVRLEGNWTSLVSQWMMTDRTSPYGHWLKDALPRLAVINEFPPDTRILLPPVKLPYMVTSLEMLGVLDRCVWTSERHFSIENYYFSSPPSMVAAYSPYVVDWLRKTFLPLVKPEPADRPRRIYMRRIGDRRNVTNEAELIEFFRGIGWEIIDGAALGFREQIQLFSQAEAICGPHGSGYSNLIWTQPGCKVLEIFADIHKCAVAEWICQCLPPNQHRYLVFPSDHKYNAIVDIARIKQALDDYGLLESPAGSLKSAGSR